MGEFPNTGRLVQSTEPIDIPGQLQALVQERKGELVLYSLDYFVDKWTRNSSISSQSKPSGCLIQSNYGATPHIPGNFEAVVCEGSNLVHYSRTSDKDSRWQKIVVISTKCLQPASLIQARPIGPPASNPGNFEVAVLEAKEGGGSQLVLYTRDNTKPKPQWTTTPAVISTLATGSGALIQNRNIIPRAGPTGNYELVVLEGKNLVHYSRNAMGTSWVKGQNVISSQATLNGPGSITQSTLTIKPASNGDFEVVVLEDRNLFLYSSQTPPPGAPREWKKDAKPITNKALGPGSIIQRADDENGDFEVIVLEESSNSTVLARYSRDNSNPARRWIRRNNVSDVAIG